MEQQMTALTSVNSPRKVAGTLVACAVTSGIFASTGLGLAPTANASCVSLFGIPSGGCTSTLFSVGIAIGDGAVANANGLFGAAFSFESSMRSNGRDLAFMSNIPFEVREAESLLGFFTRPTVFLNASQPP